MKNKKSLIYGFFACITTGVVLIYAATSSSFYHDPCVIDRGGLLSKSANMENISVVEESATGYSSSANFRSYAGFLYVLPHNPLRIISPPNPGVIGTGGTTTFSWVCDWTGTWSISGLAVQKSGTCSAGVPVTTNILESDLQDDSNNVATLTVSAPPNQASINVGIVDDQTPPVFTSLELVSITGSVSDQTITQLTVRIAGQQDQIVNVNGGSFSFNCPAGTTSATIIGGNYSRVVRIVN